MHKIFFILVVLISINANASIFGEENVTLGAILSNAIQQVKVLKEQLKAANENINEVRRINEDYRRILDRVMYEAEWLKNKDPIKDIDKVLVSFENILNVGSSLPPITQNQAKGIVSGIKVSQNSHEFSSELYKQGRKNELISSTASPGLSEKLTAQNTALILQALTSIQKTQSELLKANLIGQMNSVNEQLFVKEVITTNAPENTVYSKRSASQPRKSYFKGRPF